MSSRPVTQADLAKALNLGQRTVSRAFDDPAKVAPATLARILAEARRLGYQLNHGAMAMRTGRTRQVALAQSVEPMRSFLPPQLLGAIHDHLEEDGLTLRMLRLPEDGDRRWEEVPQLVHRLGCDGLLINLDLGVPPALGLMLRRLHLPAVFVNSRQPFDCVYPDDLQAGAMAARSLIQAGHTRIAYVDQWVDNLAQPHYSRSDRRSGCRAALAAAGLQPLEFCPAARIEDGDFALALGAWWQAQGPTAAVTYGDAEASALILAAGRLGLAVPEQVGIAAIAERPLLCGLPLTTVVHDFAAVGARAVAELGRRLAGGAGDAAAIAVSPRLVPGRSTPQRG